MILLGIETSCDETAAAVVRDGAEVLSNVIVSQIDIFAAYGGVIPEVAARSHIEAILPVVDKALSDAHMTWDDIDGIAVTQGPGLLGSLLIGVLTARMLSKLHKKPLYAVNHVVAHTYANMLIDQEIQFPLLSLSVSGNHSHFLIFHDHLDYELLGATQDDAAGEAFDKVAKMMGLPYPGGPSVSKAALDGDENAYKLPKPRVEGKPLAFSFSGLKTAVLRLLQKEAGGDFTMPSHEIADKLSPKQVADMAASFQRVACEILADKLELAYNQYKPSTVVIAGGVAANSRLRQEVQDRLPVQMHYAPMSLCTDNAAMIAAMGYQLALQNKTADPNTLEADSNLAI
jgi:N6-L-threonylcarbamoyladenine synthase